MIYSLIVRWMIWQFSLRGAVSDFPSFSSRVCDRRFICLAANQYTNASKQYTKAPTLSDTMPLNIFAFLAFLAVTAAEGQYYPCVTTNAANGNCTALTDANINNAVNDTIYNPSYALAEWGDISDW